MNDREWWETTKLWAEMWYCGDEVCRCYRPEIERISPNYEAGYPWIKREPVWEGTFHSDPSFEEYKEQEAELREAKKRFGIPKNRNWKIVP